MTQLLVSVRDVIEMEEALAGGADLIDLKEPQYGPLGPVDRSTAIKVVRRVAGRKPLSRACGELTDELVKSACEDAAGFQFLKVGLAGWNNRDWKSALRVLRRNISFSSHSELVVVAYADHQLADSPPPEAVLDFAVREGWKTWMIDTWSKEMGNLFTWQDADTLGRWGERCCRAGMAWALAGSLKFVDGPTLRDLAPTWIAVRGSVCDGDRTGTVNRRLVSAWKSFLGTSRWCEDPSILVTGV